LNGRPNDDDGHTPSVATARSAYSVADANSTTSSCSRSLPPTTAVPTIAVTSKRWRRCMFAVVATAVPSSVTVASVSSPSKRSST
jgi:hypothetical protein